MNATISALVWCAIQVTVLTCGVAVVYLAARRVHPRAGAAAAGGGLLMVIALTVMVASPWPRWEFDRNTRHAAVTPVASETSNANAHLSPADGTSTPFVASAVQNPSYWDLFADAINRSTGGPSVESAAVDDRNALRWPTMITAVLLGGALLAAVQLAWSVLSVRRLARSGRTVDEGRLAALVQDLQSRLDLDASLAVREVDGLSTPATVGWRRPVVLLPPAWREWSDVELQAVIAHELAHIAGRDYAVWLIARVAVVAHFYHPLVRWLAGRLQLEQELAADMTAARLLGDAKQYLHSLAALVLATPANRMTGPARTLFPSRSLLVRRVEMLRSIGTNRPRRSAVRYATLAVVILVGLAAAGLRGPGIDLASRAVAQTPGEEGAAAATAGAVERLSLDVVPLDAIYVLSVRVAELANDPGMGPLVKSLVARVPHLHEVKLTANDVAEVMFVPYGSMRGSQNVRIVLRLQSPEAKQRLLAWYEKQPGVEKDGERDIWTEGTHAEVSALDDVTVVFDTVHTQNKEHAPLENVKPRWAAAWNERKDKLVLAALDVPAELRAAVQKNALSEGPRDLMSAAISPLLNDVKWVMVDLEFKEFVNVSAIAQCNDEKSATSVSETVKALVVLLRNSGSQMTQVDGPNGQEAAVFKRLLAEVDSSLATAKITSEGNQVKASLHTEISTSDTVRLAMSLLPSVEKARSAARSQQSMNNLKQLALAMHNHHEMYKALPAAVGYTYRVGNETRTSKHPHSWRIDMLPYIEQQPLYDKYHFEEPWDSEANLEFAKQMPIQFRSPFDPDQKSTNTSYFVFTGDTTMFPDKKAAEFREITDGVSKTFMIVEAKNPVLWTKPEDMPYAADKPVPKIEGWIPGRLQVAFGDGSVRPVADTIDEATLRAFITKGGSELTGEPPAPK